MNTSKPILINYTWSQEVFVSASQATYEFELKHSPKRFLGWFFIGLSQFGVVAALKKDAYGLLLISSILVIYWYVLRWPIRRFMIIRSFKSSPSKNHTFKITATEEGIQVDSTMVSWKDITEVISLEKAYLLYYGTSFLFIPKSAFANDKESDRFSNLVKNSVTSYKKDT